MMDFGTNENHKISNNVKMSGFLEKKGKMKLMSGWKKYWFVLEERLLLYYRSEVEYTNLSPCRGSLNMGLVSTVRPGSSSGPCVIHVITRTQVIQLRAKNRTTQEEWLQALLLSMSLPLVKNSLKPISMSNCIESSSKNYYFDDKLKHANVEKEWTIPRILEYRKKQISGTLYGGSLDTAIWSKKCKALKTQSPKILKRNVLERILSFSKESDPFGLKALGEEHSQIGLPDDTEMKYLEKKYHIDEECEDKINIRCKMHYENMYGVADKNKKKIKKTLSDTELNKISTLQNLDYVTTDKKEELPFGRIRSVLSRASKDKMLKPAYQGTEKKEKNNKRRRSFLQKVFRKKDNESNVYGSYEYDPVYYTIENLQESKSIAPLSSGKNYNITINETEDSLDSISSAEGKESLYAEVQKTIAGSKTILTAQALTELKTRLKTRENLEHKKNFPENCGKNVENEQEIYCRTRQNPSPPSLPPRRVSRPISPWHDVPTNNTPVNSDKKQFFVHHSLVKFYDSDDVLVMEEPKTENEVFNEFGDHNKYKEIQTNNTEKIDNLNQLLEQLTEITVAPFPQTERPLDHHKNRWYDSQNLCTNCQNSDPDYDIPRPHNLMNIIISEGNEIIPSTEFLGRHDNSDTSLSFLSIEPDSLETSKTK